MLTLCLDGATDRCCAALTEWPGEPSPGVAAADPCRVIGSRVASEAKAHARTLLRMADELLGEVDACPGDLGSVVVGIGPGTFTGVRVAVASARALALSLDIPVFGVSTHAALASAIAASPDAPSVIVPVIDARRAQVFWTMYEREDAHRSARWTRRTGWAVGAWADLVRDAERACSGGRRGVIVGQALGELESGTPSVQVHYAAVQAEFLVVGQERLCGADGLLTWAGGSAAAPGRRLIGDAGPQVERGLPETVRPIYVRQPDADLHISKMKDPWGTSR